MNRTLTITARPDWKASLRSATTRTKAGVTQGKYQGETLNFASRAEFFSRLTGRRWDMVSALQDAGVVGVRELARRLDRDVRRVHDDAAELVALGLLERTESGALLCPYTDIHVDMHLVQAA